MAFTRREFCHMLVPGYAWVVDRDNPSAARNIGRVKDVALLAGGLLAACSSSPAVPPGSRANPLETQISDTPDFEFDLGRILPTHGQIRDEYADQKKIRPGTLYFGLMHQLIKQVPFTGHSFPKGYSSTSESTWTIVRYKTPEGISKQAVLFAERARLSPRDKAEGMVIYGLWVPESGQVEDDAVENLRETHFAENAFELLYPADAFDFNHSLFGYRLFVEIDGPTGTVGISIPERNPTGGEFEVTLDRDAPQGTNDLKPVQKNPRVTDALKNAENRRNQIRISLAATATAASYTPIPTNTPTTTSATPAPGAAESTPQVSSQGRQETQKNPLDIPVNGIVLGVGAAVLGALVVGLGMAAGTVKNLRRENQGLQHERDQETARADSAERHAQRTEQQLSGTQRTLGQVRGAAEQGSANILTRSADLKRATADDKKTIQGTSRAARDLTDKARESLANVDGGVTLAEAAGLSAVSKSEAAAEDFSEVAKDLVEKIDAIMEGAQSQRQPGSPNLRVVPKRGQGSINP